MEKQEQQSVLKSPLRGDLEGRLPLPNRKNLLKLAFSAPELPNGVCMKMSKTCFYTITNQWYMQAAWQINTRLSSFKTAVADFEFNKPILKKGPPILKDFEKNSTDFERFAMDFEKVKPIGRPISSIIVLKNFFSFTRIEKFTL
jgi:hypothetical protein